MGQAIEMGLRDQFITLKRQGYSLRVICERVQLRYATACQWSRQLRQQGNLTVAYANCGLKQPRSNTLIVRAALWLKRLHPLWGAPYIHLQLVRRYGSKGLPRIRTLQRWFRRRQLTQPRQAVSQPEIGRAKAVHNIWQVDAKERLRLVDGTPACYLSIVDEHSGAGLAALVFPLWLSQSGAHRSTP